VKNMNRQTAVKQSSLYSAPWFIALLSILLPSRLVALDLDPVRVGGFDTSGQALGVTVSGNYAYVADWDAGLQVIDVSNPATTQRVGGYDTSGFARSVAVSGNCAYVADSTAGLQMIDVSNPANPQRVGGHDTGLAAQGVAVSGNYAYVADYDAGLQVIDVSNPASPQRVGGYDTSGVAFGVAVSGNYAYVADGNRDGLHVIDVSNPASPQRVGGNPIVAASNLIVAGNKVFAAAGSDGLVILDLFRPSLRLELVSPQQSGSFRFLVRGQAGLSVRIQRSANLRDWENWQTLTLGATPGELSDLDTGANPDRFYRAVTP
jgi:hypothetical protein